MSVADIFKNWLTIGYILGKLSFEVWDTFVSCPVIQDLSRL